MKEGQKLWTRDELILAINLYCKLPFGKMHKSNKDIIKLSTLIERTPSSIALKLVNFASFDPSLKERGIKGASNASKLDKQIWDEFYNNWDAALLESELLLAKTEHTTVEHLNDIDISDIPTKGLEKKRLVNTRINQCIFRRIVLATYNYKCCITGIDQPELLVASHIVPWSKDEKNRMNPMNGLLLNALHDRAFDAGLITIDADNYSLCVSKKLTQAATSISLREHFIRFEGQIISLPNKFLPDKSFLKYHNDHLFN
jgi:putative restriction endonuclease